MVRSSARIPSSPWRALPLVHGSLDRCRISCPLPGVLVSAPDLLAGSPAPSETRTASRSAGPLLRETREGCGRAPDCGAAAHVVPRRRLRRPWTSYICFRKYIRFGSATACCTPQLARLQLPRLQLPRPQLSRCSFPRSAIFPPHFPAYFPRCSGPPDPRRVLCPVPIVEQARFDWALPGLRADRARSADRGAFWPYRRLSQPCPRRGGGPPAAPPDGIARRCLASQLLILGPCGVLTSETTASMPACAGWRQRSSSYSPSSKRVARTSRPVCLAHASFR